MFQIDFFRTGSRCNAHMGEAGHQKSLLPESLQELRGIKSDRTFNEVVVVVGSSFNLYAFMVYLQSCETAPPCGAAMTTRPF